MLVSIIIANLNQATMLAKTLKSIAEQTYTNIEVWVIDGASTDDSCKVAREFNANLVSEPDEGISDAFNKGVIKSRGDYLYFMGAGDTFVNDTSLAILSNYFTDENMLICGRIARTDEQGKKIHWLAPKQMPKTFDRNIFKRCMFLPHQGLLTHRNFFMRWGIFDKTVRYAMDYELLLRSFHDFPGVKLVDTVIATWRGGGIGTGHEKKVLQEYYRIRKQHKIDSPLKLWLGHRYDLFKMRIKQALRFFKLL